MHLSGCIFILAMTLLGTFSVTIKMRDGDKCLEGGGKSSFGMMECDPNSPSQKWTVDGDHIKHNKLQLCFADGSLKDGSLVPCEFTPSANKSANEIATKDRKMRIEGKILKNYNNHCLRFGLKGRFFWSDCGGHEHNIAIVT
jgi:hypothetical protein